MSIGRCEYTLCDSVIATEFQTPVYFNHGGGRLVTVMMCPEHQRLCEPISHGGHPGKVMMTKEGWIYVAYWMDALGFYRWSV